MRKRNHVVPVRLNAKELRDVYKRQPEGYEIAEDVKFTLEDTMEVQKVEMKDARTPETPGVPQTGDVYKRQTEETAEEEITEEEIEEMETAEEEPDDESFEEFTGPDEEEPDPELPEDAEEEEELPESEEETEEIS